MTIQRPPVIGVTLDIDHLDIETEQACYILRDNIFAAVAEAEAVPLALPHYKDAIDIYLDRVDGVIVVGDVVSYRLEIGSSNNISKARRADFELGVITHALERHLPLLGICGGMQLIGVANGAILTDLPEAYRAAHQQPKPYSRASHEITIEPDSALQQHLKCSSLSVNSVHGQTLTDLPDNVLVSARSGDGVIEAIELAKVDFALGVQWHPEYRINHEERGLFKGLVMAAKRMIVE